MLRRWSVRLIILFQLALLSALSQASLLDSLMGSKPKLLPVAQAIPIPARVEQEQRIATFDTNNDRYLIKQRLFIEQNGAKRAPFQLSQTGIEKEDEYFGQISAFYAQLEARFNLSALAEGTVTLHHQGCAEAGLCYPPQTKTFELTADNIKKLDQTLAASSSPTVTTNTAKHSWFDGKSWWAIAGIFFALGLGLTF